MTSPVWQQLSLQRGFMKGFFFCLFALILPFMHFALILPFMHPSDRAAG